MPRTWDPDHGPGASAPPITKRILVVDQAPAIREPVATVLQAAGYDAVAADYRDTMRAITAARTDLIVLGLPAGDRAGLALLAAIRARPRVSATPVLLLAAAPTREDLVEAARLGVSACLLQSQFSLEALLARTAALLGVLLISAGAAAEPPGRSGAPGPAGAAAAASALSRAESLKILVPLLSRAQMEAHLDGCAELRALSPASAQILQITGRAQCRIEDVVGAIKQDQAIALKVLRLANSVVYTRGDPVESVQKAVMRIGLRQIRHAVLNIGVVERFQGGPLGQADLPRFWEHSIACGLVAACLTRAQGLGEEQVDAAFTAGLLHDMGRMVFAERLGEAYGPVLQAARRCRLPLEQVESRMLLINHADAMERLVRLWRFPKHLAQPIALHHLSLGSIRQQAPNGVQPAATLALANRLTHALLLGDSGNETIYPTQELCLALGIGPEPLRRIEEEVPAQLDDITLALLSRSDATPWKRTRDLARGRLSAPMRPLFVGPEGGLDGIRLVVERLGDPAGEAPPNLAVVHLENAQARSAMGADLTDAERTAGASNLPLLVLSPKPQPQEGTLDGRRCAHLSTPVNLNELTETINRLITV